MSASRQPSDLPVRIGAVARLPVFFGLEGKRVVVVGGSAAAAWKAELLAAAGAAVEVFAENPSGEMIAAVAETTRGSIAVHDRPWRATDLAGSTLTVGAFDDDDCASRFAGAARQAGVPVNIIDRPSLCDFIFGSIVNRSPLVIGISTDGAAPILAQAIRARIEAMLPAGLARWVEAAHRWRNAVQSLSRGARRAFWETFCSRALAHPNRAPHESDLAAFAAGVRKESADEGAVTLVGAGPGDPELLTLRAVRALQSADVILFDDLVSREVLDFARREARKMLVGKTGHGLSCRQDDINALMVALARNGKRVVRLKGGDPMIFARGGEEIAACRKAGIAIEVVPGITAAQGAAARIGTALTDRLCARRLQYVTGHDRHGGLPSDIDWRALGDPTVTTAVYMPARTLPQLAMRAMAHGLAAETPAVAIAGATRPDEKILWATIATLPERLASEPMEGPLLVLIGRALEARNRVAAAAATPHEGQRVGAG
jgi:uroporphyrin-III C-methyltransferase/precorrin-2 dehydrogenase/sirohydrochlorin ferrochelatase